MKLKKAFEIVIKLLKSKYYLRLPQKARNLIFDSHSTTTIKKIFNNINFSVLDTRYESINLRILIKTLLEFKFTYGAYLKKYIEYVNPKILITLIDNNKFFYEIKLSRGKKIFIQGSRRGQVADIFYILNTKKTEEKYNVDYMFVQNKKKAITTAVALCFR